MNSNNTPHPVSRSRASLLARAIVGVLLGGLAVVFASRVASWLAKDACLDAGGRLHAGDICELPNMATQHVLSLLKGPVLGAVFCTPVLLAVYVWFLICRRLPDGHS
jgi:hypothetical protein